MAAVMPQQKPGRSKQNYRTPQEFLRAAEHKLGITAFSFDLAADDDNAVCDLYYTVRENALVCDWNPDRRYATGGAARWLGLLQHGVWRHRAVGGEGVAGGDTRG